MKAIVKGMNIAVDIYQCSNSSCKATIKGSEEELNRNRTIEVTVE